MRDTFAMIGVLCLLGITVALPLWQHYGMTKTFTIDAHSDYDMRAYADNELGGVSTARLEKTDKAILFHCHIRAQYAWPYCAMSIVFTPSADGIDLSNYSQIAIDMETVGSAALPVKIYLRSYRPTYAAKDDEDSYKLNQIQFIPARQPRPLRVPLANFQVATWWVSQYNIPPKYASPDLSNVIYMQIATGDNTKPGVYTLRVHSITFIGKWLSPTQVFVVILVLWFLAGMYYIAITAARNMVALRAVRAQRMGLAARYGQLEREHELVADEAMRDELTGISNRKGLEQYLKKVAESRTLSLVFMDIDHFKLINDSCGHLVGDAVLTTFAQTILAATRGADFLCRWGGEEFLLVCPDTALDDATYLARKLRELVVSAEWPQSIELSASFGVAQRQPHEPVNTLLARADAALYDAKGLGRNRVVAARPQTEADSG